MPVSSPSGFFHNLGSTPASGVDLQAAIAGLDTTIDALEASVAEAQAAAAAATASVAAVAASASTAQASIESTAATATTNINALASSASTSASNASGSATAAAGSATAASGSAAAAATSATNASGSATAAANSATAAATSATNAANSATASANSATASATSATNAASSATAAATSAAIVVSDYVAKAGATMTGPLELSGNPSANLHAAPRQYVDARVPAAKTAVAQGSWGGTFDLTTPDVSFFEIAIPTGTRRILATGFARGEMVAASAALAVFSVGVYTSGGTAVVAKTASTAAASGTNSAYFNASVPFGVELDPTPAGCVLRFSARKSAAVGPFNLYNYDATALFITD